jgi:hypothetical protein
MGLKERTMPRDVSTRWNSTYEMLNFALEHQEALTKMTADKDNGLQAYEMTRKEWLLAKQLEEVLKVSKERLSNAEQ